MENFVRQFREEKRLTQEQLGKEVGVSRQTIISIESGRYIASLELALKISKYFHTSVESLFILGRK